MAFTPTNICCLDPSKSNDSASLRLFCFPYAGASSYSFRSWLDYLPKTIKICPIELPGRGIKIEQKPYQRIEPLVKAIALEILPYLDKPFAFFGHSMGGLVSFELARFIRRQYNLEPVHLFISGRRAPQTKNFKPPIHNLPEADFLQELRQLNGTPEEVLNNHELMELLMPILRAYFTVLETYIYSDEAPLNCPISVFGGLQDKEVSIEQLEAWQAQTCNSFDLKMLPGDHFFIHSSQSFLPELIQQLNVYH
ncbi:putative thioesterase [Pleurocapsa sp. CCALA 161]|uniref:thioesterase II family protein n=1 Tax=Pleurocapsa sp. CCALA 161 TaxID=2107688 RepID=UPI000D04B109|nr:thioesterase II family protein [Pleurocapsa sp. CCALA 161]PSB11062.1 putative thioesterase [Pleurocapsa sp. CCALA 161]